jgi:hypothetical protein
MVGFKAAWIMSLVFSGMSLVCGMFAEWRSIKKMELKAGGSEGEEKV